MPVPKTILIIDDEISILEGLISFFEDEGYRVLSARDGESGLDLFLTNNVDLLITDLRMPGKDGLEVMKTVRKRSPGTPMIVISGAGKKEDIIRALRIGAHDYITKPIEDLDVISRTVYRVLENKQLNDENTVYREKLEKSELRYRTITENIAEGVFTVDEFENFTYANQVFCGMIGYSNLEILSKNLKDVSTEDSFKTILKQTQNRKAGATDRYIVEMHNSNGDTIHVELACSPISNPKDPYQGAIAVARDVTRMMELRRTYEDFIESQTAGFGDVTPICASCKNIRMAKGSWVPIEEFFHKISFSHGICSTCCAKLYPEFHLTDLEKE